MQKAHSSLLTVSLLSREDTSSLAVLTKGLTRAGVLVKGPWLGKYEGWTPYEVEVGKFAFFDDSDILIALNQSERSEKGIDEHMIMDICYAFLKQKPLIMLSAPKYELSVPLELRRIVESRESETTVSDLILLDDTGLSKILDEITQLDVDYKLNSLEKHTIERFLKSHLRNLISGGVNND